MNREIKFRAWHKDDKEMWLPEHLNNNDFTLNVLRGKLEVWDKPNFDYNNPNSDYELITHDYLIPMQYVGNFDAENPVDLYEGDIVSVCIEHCDQIILMITGVIVYDKSYSAFMLMPFDNSANINLDIEYGYELLGNVFQNPELLPEELKSV